MARLYSNENFPLPVVEELRRLGHDVLTVLDAGNAGQAIPDEDVLTFATQDNRAVLTLNRKHFVRLQGVMTSHAGIVVCTFNSDFFQQASLIDEALRAVSSVAGLLLRVNRPQAKD